MGIGFEGTIIENCYEQELGLARALDYLRKGGFIQGTTILEV